MDPLFQASPHKGSAVVYGVYDSSGQPFSIRLKDFFIDRSRVGIKEKSYFFHLLGTMLDAGIPIVQALNVLAKKTKHERFARIVNTLAYDVERGRLLSQSMSKFPDLFKESEMGVIRSGEAVGNLPQLLFKLSDQTARAHALLLKVRGALIYPVTVLFALLVSGAIVVSVVIPRLSQFFEQANVTMPFATRFILSAGQWLLQFPWLILSVLAVIFLTITLSLGTDSGKRRWDAFSMRLPFAGDVIRKLNVARFVQMFSILIEAGVPVNEAIRIAGGALQNSLYKDFIVFLRQEVEQGKKLAPVLEEAPFLFPETVSAMVSVGESTGQLGKIADKLAAHYENEVQNTLTDMTALLEPLVIIFVGVAVGIFALALLGPIFSLSTLVA